MPHVITMAPANTDAIMLVYGRSRRPEERPARTRFAMLSHRLFFRLWLLALASSTLAQPRSTSCTCWPQLVGVTSCDEEAQVSEVMCCSRPAVPLELFRGSGQAYQYLRNLTLPWNMVNRSCYPLSTAAFQRALALRGDARMRQLVRRVAEGANLRVVMIGSSAALGQGALGSGNKRAAASTEIFVNGFLKQRYPNSNIEYLPMAIPGTTTASRVTGAGLFDVAQAAPDLVIWDFAPNDYSRNVFSTERLRAHLEHLARAVLRLPSKPAFLILSLLRTGRNDDEGGWSFQDLAVRPVAELYGLPMVSYRDAVWPVHDQPQRPRFAYDNAHDNQVHIMWYTHILISDVLAFAWVALEDASSAAEDDRAELEPLPPSRFAAGDADMELATPCTQGWLTSLVGAEGEASLAPSLEPHAAWSFRKDRGPSKQGWQFNASRSDLGASSQGKKPAMLPVIERRPPIWSECTVKGWRGNPMHSFCMNITIVRERLEMARQLALDAARRTVVLEPITFPIHVGNEPRVAVSFLKSYSQFGRVMYWFDDGKAETLRRHRQHIAAALVCTDHAKACFHGKAGTTQLDATNFECMGLAEKYAAGCERLLRGAGGSTTTSPFEVDGSWEDHSSQMFTAGLAGASKAPTSKDEGHPSTMYTVNRSLPVVSPGWHNISFGLLWPTYEADLVTSLLENNQSSPWETVTQSRPMFKVMSVFSC